MQRSLGSYKVRLIIGGIDREGNPAAPDAVSAELAMRPHIRNTIVAWLNDQHSDVIVELETDGLGAERTGNGMAEELFEVTVAVLPNPEGVHVNVSSVEEISGASSPG